MVVADVPRTVVQAAAAFGLDTSALRPLGGASGSSWDAGSRVLRFGPRARMDMELAAATAAARVLPVPRVVSRAEVGGDSVVLLEKLPGQPAADLARQRPELARAAGRVCGAVHALLAGAPLPAGLPPVHAAPSGLTGTDRACVLHLDLHPLNVLLSEKAELTGVLDWANAAAGPAILDRARIMSSTLTGLGDARRRLGVPGSRCTCGVHCLSSLRCPQPPVERYACPLQQAVRPARRLHWRASAGPSRECG